MRGVCFVSLLWALGCSGCCTVRCPEVPKCGESHPLPPQDKSGVIQTSQEGGKR